MTNIFATPTVITPEQRKRRDIYRNIGRYLCDQLEWTEEQIHAWIEKTIAYWAEYDRNWPTRDERDERHRWWCRAEDEVRLQWELLNDWKRARKERRDEAFDALWEHVADILGEKPEYYAFAKALDVDRINAWHTKSRDAVTLWFTLNAEDFRSPRCACGAAPDRVDGAGVGWCKRCDTATDRIALDLGPVDDLPY
jgi:hypothetical protein